MTAEHIIGIYVVIEETMRALGHTSHLSWVGVHGQGRDGRMGAVV